MTEPAFWKVDLRCRRTRAIVVVLVQVLGYSYLRTSRSCVKTSRQLANRGRRRCRFGIVRPEHGKQQQQNFCSHVHDVVIAASVQSRHP